MLSMDMMSSEESVTDEGEEVLKIRKLSWRKPVVDEMFEKLDSAANTSKTPQARRQMKRRVLGEASNDPSLKMPPNGQ